MPRYYQTLEKFKVPVMDFIRMMFYEEPYPMLSEVMLMLKEEVGREYKTYFSILQAIAEGNLSIGEKMLLVKANTGIHIPESH